MHIRYTLKCIEIEQLMISEHIRVQPNHQLTLPLFIISKTEYTVRHTHHVYYVDICHVIYNNYPSAEKGLTAHGGNWNTTES